MSTQQYLDELNECFKKKTSFYNEMSWRQMNPSPSESIINLHKLGYDFTQKEFDNFITNATHQKGRGYIATYPYNNDKRIRRTQVIDIMFSKFTPSEKQFKMLFACAGTGANDWINVMIKRNYIFNDKQKKELINIGYDTTKLYVNKTNLLLDEIKIVIQSTLNAHSNCADLITIINNNIVEYPPDFINWVLDQLPCQNVGPINIKHHKDVLDIFLKQLNLKFNENSLTYVYKFNSCEFVYYCVENGLIPNNESMTICAKTPKFIELLFYFHIKFGLKITTEIMNDVIQKKYNYINHEYVAYNHYYSTSDDLKVKIMLETFGYDTNIINEAKTTQGISIYKLFRLLNVIPNEETFLFGCKQQLKYVVDDCTKIFKMYPTSEHLQSILSNGHNVNMELLNDILCYKILPTKGEFNILLNSSGNSDAIELLIKYGLVLDIIDIKNSLYRKIIIKDLDRFNIPYDETLYYYCYLHNTFPYDNEMQIDANIFELRKMCRNKLTTVEKFAEYINKTNITPDKYCFDHACANNYAIMEYMLKQNFNPTPIMHYWLGCSKNIFYGLSNQHEQFIKFHNMDMNYMQSKYSVDFETK